jgi:glutathione synthase/RimK-type ligase-like ATP-grasp enzyme
MLQHRAAAQIGLAMPETLYTNSPSEVRAFIQDKKGKVIYKPFLPTGWTNGPQQFMPYTALLNDESLVDETLRFTPGIFQELIPKAYEVRLTMIGRRAFAAKIHSQETAAGRLDWRRAYSELRFEALDLPPHIEKQCASLLETLGLVFGCLDFIVTPEGEHIFLEVNEMGQFLFVERYSNLPLLDAFVSFLVQGKSDFEWSPDDVSIRYSNPQFEALVKERADSFSRAHVSLPARLIDEAD